MAQVRKKAVHPPPYVSADKSLPETTVLAVVLGLILAIVMGAANTYLGLYAGMTVSASIPAAVVSMAILRGVFRRGTVLENNIAQTLASTGESLAAGAIFTIPALVLVGAWQEFEFWPTTFIIMLGGLLGVVFMVPLRRALIVDRPDLTYPEGVACANVLVVGQEGGTGIRYIGIGLLLGGIFKYLVSGLALIRGTVEGAVASGQRVFYGGADMSLALLAVGYIVNLQIASQVFLGGVIGWVIGVPLMGGYTEGAPVEHAGFLWSTQVRYMGVGAMLVGGLYSIFSVRAGIGAALRSVRGAGERGTGADVLRTERDMPVIALGTIFLLTVFGTFILYDFLIGSGFVALVAAVMMIIAAFLFVAVATYIVGLVGSSNSPVSGMTISALLMTAVVLLVLGVKGDSAILATLGVAGVVCCAACTSGDIAQDLKTGLIVGATPARQQWVEILAVVVPAFFFAPIMTFLHNAYVIGEGLAAPQATLFASLAEGFFGDGDIPFDMVAIGAVIGAAIIIGDILLVRGNLPMRLHVMAVAVGIYLPFALAVPIFIGGLLRWATHRRRTEDLAGEAQDHGVLFGSGLIAGEALMGIGIAIPITFGWHFLTVEGTWWFSLLAFTAVIALFAAIARK